MSKYVQKQITKYHLLNYYLNKDFYLIKKNEKKNLLWAEIIFVGVGFGSVNLFPTKFKLDFQGLHVER